MRKKGVVLVCFIGLSLQTLAGGYTCFRCVAPSSHRTDLIKEVSTCDLDRVVDLQHNAHYHCEKIAPTP